MAPTGKRTRPLMSVVVVTAAAWLTATASPVPLHAQPPLPTAVGYVNDFANVIDSDRERRIDSLAQRVRAVTRGEMVTVTLADLGGRPVEEVALRLGREWKIGANAAVGDAARNAGVVILIVPKESSADGKGYCRIEVGQGAEGFITDGTAGEICRNQVSSFRAKEYGAAAEAIAADVAEHYAAGFGVDLEGDALSAADAEVLKGTADGEEIGVGDVLLLVFGVFAVIGLFIGGIFFYIWYSARQERDAAERAEIVAAAVAAGAHSKKRRGASAKGRSSTNSRSGVAANSALNSASSSSSSSGWFAGSSGSSWGSSSSSAFGGGGGFSGGGGGSEW